MDAAIVELDPLPDADGAAADDHGLGIAVGLGLILLLVRAVEIGRLGGELRGAGVDHLVHRQDAPLPA